MADSDSDSRDSGGPAQSLVGLLHKNSKTRPRIGPGALFEAGKGISCSRTLRPGQLRGALWAASRPNVLHLRGLGMAVARDLLSLTFRPDLSA